MESSSSHYTTSASQHTFPSRKHRSRHSSSSPMPRLRLDATILLLILFFFLGVYIPNLLDLSHSISFNPGKNAGLVDLPSLQAKVEDLTTRINKAEVETATVMEENQKLRLDNNVEQSNLKSMTKAKNEEIRKLTAEKEKLEAKLQLQGKGVPNNNNNKQQAARVQELERELNGLREQLNNLKKAPQAPPAAPPKQAQQQQEAPKQQQQPKQEVLKVQPAHDNKNNNNNNNKNGKPFLSRNTVSIPEPQPLNSYWAPRIEALFHLAQKNPTAFLLDLDNNDPLGINIEDVSDFSCPAPEERLSQPDLRRMEMASLFREGQGFVFFQHLRKAGGTGFCDLADRSMPGRVPPYYCMPDDRGTLATPPWNSSWLLDKLEEKKWRIAANEWDAFPRSKFALGDAVFSTTLRDPTDRWYSQYRFEHVEHRDGSVEGGETMPFKDWYRSQLVGNMGNNYYTKTFVGGENRPDEELLVEKGRMGKPLVHGHFYWSYDKYRGVEMEWEMFNQAVDTLRRFHLVLVLEWLEESPGMIREVLGWEQEPRQVLPHEKQARREEKKSKETRQLLPKEVYAFIREDNVLDYLFYHVAKRIFLERATCVGV